METKEIKINCPEGFEVDKENSTFECIKFKPINKELPKSWEEFCEMYPRKANEACFSYYGEIGNIDITAGFKRNKLWDKSLLPSKELAEAMLALCQLIQLRDCYNGGWKPDWTIIDGKYTIIILKNTPTLDCTWSYNRILAFKTKKLRNKFFENFKDLIEIAKPLL